MAADLPPLTLETFTLDNGLEVILHRDPAVPIAAVNLWYHVGSKNERPGRSGFAHLFEHLMFQGSVHQDTEYFGPLQEVGAQLNGSTSTDRTNYWEVVPANHLERALLLEADRMGWLLPAMTQEKLDNQRDVVRNERRQSEGQPYSAFFLERSPILYPKGHPYDHSVIGEHEDLEAATLDDVKDFFRAFYTPSNATLCLAGDFDPARARDLVHAYFGEIPPGPPVNEVRIWIPRPGGETRVRLEDRVQLTRLYLVWHTPPLFHPGDAELDLAAHVLGAGRTSRLYRSLVHDAELVQDVAAHQASAQIGSQFVVVATLKPGTAVEEVEARIHAEIDALGSAGPTEDELRRVRTQMEASFVKGLQRVGGFGGRADQLNLYNHYAGTPDYAAADLARYGEADPAAVRRTVGEWLGEGRFVFEVCPLGERTAAPPADVDRTVLPAGDPDPEIPFPASERRVLDNGLEAVVLRRDGLPLVQVQLVFRTGANSDPDGLSGLAGLSTDMLLDGTSTRDKFALEEAFEELGTDVATRTRHDYSLIGLTTLTRHLDASLELLASILTDAVFPADELERQRRRRVLNIRREGEDPNRTAAKVARRVLFGEGHPYARIPSGTVESMEAITRDDVVRRAAEHLVPGNAFLVAVGDVSADDLAAAVERHLGEWRGEAPAPMALPDPALPGGRTVYLVDKPGDSQSTVVIGHLGVPRNHPDWTRIEVANRILGGMFSSRLNLNIREDKGYSYGTRSAFGANLGRGAFTMSGRVQTEVTAPALVEFLREFDGIHGARPVTDAELAFARDSILRGYGQEFETNGEVAAAVAEQLVFGLPEDHLRAYPRDIAAVTLDDVNGAGAEHFLPDRAAVVVVGDRARIEEEVRALDLGPVVHLDADGRPVGEKA